jgi:hypothetical protein
MAAVFSLRFRRKFGLWMVLLKHEPSGRSSYSSGNKRITEVRNRHMTGQRRRHKRIAHKGKGSTVWVTYLSNRFVLADEMRSQNLNENGHRNS